LVDLKEIRDLDQVFELFGIYIWRKKNQAFQSLNSLEFTFKWILVKMCRKNLEEIFSLKSFNAKQNQFSHIDKNFTKKTKKTTSRKLKRIKNNTN